MIVENDSFLEKFWDDLLSRQPDKIMPAFQALSKEEQECVLQHLVRMREEPGWHPQQRLSAIAALDVIAPSNEQNNTC